MADVYTMVLAKRGVKGMFYGKWNDSVSFISSSKDNCQYIIAAAFDNLDLSLYKIGSDIIANGLKGVLSKTSAEHIEISFEDSTFEKSNLVALKKGASINIERQSKLEDLKQKSKLSGVPENLLEVVAQDPFSLSTKGLAEKALQNGEAIALDGLFIPASGETEGVLSFDFAKDSNESAHFAQYKVGMLVNVELSLEAKERVRESQTKVIDKKVKASDLLSDLKSQISPDLLKQLDEYILVDRLYVLEKYKSYRTLQKHTTIALDNMAKEGYNKEMTELIVLSGKARKEYYLIQAEDPGAEAAAQAPMSQEEVDALMDVDPSKLSLEELNSLINQTADKLGVDPEDL